MGKSTLLEAMYRLARKSSASGFWQGRPDDLPSSGIADGADTKACSGPPGLLSVAFLSSDGFLSEEFRAIGVGPTGAGGGGDAEGAPHDDDAAKDARQRATWRFNAAVESFMKRVRFASTQQTERTAGQADGHLLILDKNFPPDGQRSMAEMLCSLRPPGCEVRLKHLVLSESGSPETLEALERLEVAEYGPWQYPWSPEAVLECAARLLRRDSHETLNGCDFALYLLLSHMKLHHTASVPGRSRPRRPVDALKPLVVHVPCVMLAGDAAEWTDLTSSSPEAVWRRFEARLLLREALGSLKPFSDPLGSAPMTAALRKVILAAGLRPEKAQVVNGHAEGCAEKALADVLAAPSVPVDELSAPAVTFVSVSSERFHHQLLSALRMAADAMRQSMDNGADDPFPFPPFNVPRALHVTTLFLGGAAQTDEQRQLLGESRELFRAGAAYDTTVTHIICARGALACAVVDAEKFASQRVPISSVQVPHITLCTRRPWAPKHSNDLLAAARNGMSDARCDPGAGYWEHQLAVGEATLDVFVYRLPEPLLLPQGRLMLH